MAAEEAWPQGGPPRQFSWCKHPQPGTIEACLHRPNARILSGSKVHDRSCPAGARSAGKPPLHQQFQVVFLNCFNSFCSGADAGSWRSPAPPDPGGENKKFLSCSKEKKKKKSSFRWIPPHPGLMQEHSRVSPRSCASWLG